MTPTELKQSLSKLTYPCYLVAYGPERSYRTKYRCEHEGGFNCGIVYSIDEAFQLIENTHYPGHYSEMILNAVFIEDGELRETQI
jgi:hypothetical protein